MNWYSLTPEEALKQTGSNPNGLDEAAVKQKLQEHGKNELKGKKKVSPLVIFIRQFLDAGKVFPLPFALFYLFLHGIRH